MLSGEDRSNSMGENLTGWVVSVNVGPGGVPRHPTLAGAVLRADGLEGDVRAFAKHNKPDRALSIHSIELQDELQAEGYPVAPGLMAENVTVRGVDLKTIADGSVITFDGGPVVLVSCQRKPCYQLNPVKDGLDAAAVGRSGVLCSVVKEGLLKPGMRFTIEPPASESA